MTSENEKNKTKQPKTNNENTAMERSGKVTLKENIRERNDSVMVNLEYVRGEQDFMESEIPSNLIELDTTDHENSISTKNEKGIKWEGTREQELKNVNKAVERSGNVTDKVNITDKGEYLGNDIRGNEPEPNTTDQGINAKENKTSEDNTDVTREWRVNNKSILTEKSGNTVVMDVIREKHDKAKERQDHMKSELSRNQVESNKLNEESNNDDKSKSSEDENEITNEYEANNENDDMEWTGRTLVEEIIKEKKDNTEVKQDHMMNETSSSLTECDITVQEYSNSEMNETSEAEKDMRKHENDIVSSATVYSGKASHKDNIKACQENTRENVEGFVNENEAVYEGYGECDDMYTDWDTRNRRRTAAAPPTPFLGITRPLKDPDISKLQVSM